MDHPPFVIEGLAMMQRIDSAPTPCDAGALYMVDALRDEATII